LGRGSRTAQDAQDAELTTQSKVAAALASIAGKQEEVRAKQIQNNYAEPGGVMDRAMMASGVPLDAARDVGQYLQSGRIDRYEMAPGMAGPVLPAPVWSDPKNMSRLAQRLSAEQSVLSGGAKDQTDYYKGQNQQFETGLAQDVAGGTMPQTQIGRAMALLKASPMYHASENGSVLGLFDGNLNEGGGLAQGNIGLVGAKTTEQQAAAAHQRGQAAQAYAAAGKSNAEAAATRSANAPGASNDLSNGKAPQGYVWGPKGPDGNPTMIAVKGGPADQKIAGQFNADTAALTNTSASMDRLATAANEVLNHPGLKSIYGLRGVLPNIPGGDAADAAALLNTLKSQVGFGVLQDMRNNSKTGGALGAVSDKENAMLQANLAALEKAQSVEQAKKSLQKIIDYTEGAKGRMRLAYNLRHANQIPSDALVPPPAVPGGVPTAPRAPSKPIGGGFTLNE
jgi:hypothetical protein